MTKTERDEAVNTAADDVVVAPAAVIGSGLSDAEIIALRTTDTDKTASSRYVKTFVHGPGPKPIPANGVDYAASEAAVREYAIQNGLRPTGAVRLDGIEQNRDGVAWDLTFSVAVIPTERAEGPSEPDFVLQGEEAPANTDGAGHSGDTRKKLT